MADKKKTKAEIMDEAAKAQDELDASVADALEKNKLTPEEDYPRKRRAWLCATIGDTKGNNIADEEEKSGWKKVLWPPSAPRAKAS